MLKLCNLRSGSSNKQHQLSYTAKQLNFASHHQLRALPLGQYGSTSNSIMINGGAQSTSSSSTAAAFSIQMASQSLFNKLDSFVHQLQTSRSFFATWPERLCRRLRQPQTVQPIEQHKHSNAQRIGLAINETTQHQQTGGVCWNGVDFSG